jgi:UDP-2-acetamido-3-amino-2,3-dideoxy-glucuronate N-acetyltransferase
MHDSNIIKDKKYNFDIKSIKGHFNIIHTGVVLGENTKIGNYCEIGRRTIIGKNCKLQSRVRTGKDVIICDNITIKFGSSLTEGMIVHNNTFIGPSVIFLGSDHKRKSKLGTIIGTGCYIGAGVKVMPGVKICNNVVIGANSFVNKNITSPGTYVGNPCKKIK